MSQDFYNIIDLWCVHAFFLPRSDGKQELNGGGGCGHSVAMQGYYDDKRVQEVKCCSDILRFTFIRVKDLEGCSDAMLVDGTSQSWLQLCYI